VQATPSTTTTRAGSTPNSAAELVNTLFRRLVAIKPGWRAAFTPEEIGTAKAEWTRAFIQAGIEDWAVIERALDELRLQPGPFLPSTGDFIALCRRAQLTHWRVPTEAEGFSQLQKFFGPRGVKRDFTKLNPAVYAAYCRLDWGLLSGQPTPVQRKGFAEAWKVVLEDIQMGRPLPQPMPPERQIESDERALSKEENARKLAELRAQHGL